MTIPKGQEEVPANVDGVASEHSVEDMLDDSYDPLEEEATEEVVEEEEQESFEEEDTPVEDVVEEEEAVVEEPVVEEKSDVDTLREQLAHLSAVLMQHGINPADIGKEVEGQVTETPKPPVDKMEIELKPFELSKEDFEAVFESPEKFIEVLNRVRESAVEQVLRSIPTVTAKIVNQQTVLNRMVQDFYTANNDLAGVKPFVAVVANEIAARNPGWNVEKVFAEAAVESRKRLKLKKEVVAPTNDVRKPGLPKSTVSRRTPAKPALSKLEQELQDLM